MNDNENINQSLIRIGNNQLVKTHNSIQLTNKLLLKNTERKIVEYLVRHPDIFIEFLSSYYPLTNEIIQKYRSKLLFKINKSTAPGLSINTNIKWTREILTNFIIELDWEDISRNKAIPWSDDLITEFEHLLDFNKMSFNHSIPWSIELIDKYFSKWSWGSEYHSGLSENESIPWSIEFIECYEENWNWGKEFAFDDINHKHKNFYYKESYRNGLSRNTSLPWDQYLFEKYEDRWNYKILSGNPSLPWSIEFIAKHESKWYWNPPSNEIELYRSICDNPNIPWSIDLIERFKSHLDSYCGLTCVMALVPWSQKMFDKYKNDKTWFGFSRNPNLPWSLDFFLKYRNNWNLHQISKNTGFCWTKEIIEYLTNEHKMSIYPYEQWSADLIKKYYPLEKDLDQYVLGMEGAQWDIDLVLYFENKIERNNTFFTKNIWDKVFKDFLTDEMIDEIFNRI